MLKEAIILAGGLGTRLRTAVPDLPKCLAPILAKPFLGYLLEYLQREGVTKFVFALGYKHELIAQYVNTQFASLDISFSVENEPMGTGGAIALACNHINGEDCLIINGDTFFGADLSKLSDFHLKSGSACTLVLKPMLNFERYGTVSVTEQGQVTGFHEKKRTSEGLINGGIYALKKTAFLHSTQPLHFSFETDFLNPSVQLGNISAITEDKFFIDIGIPEDFDRAQTELPLNFQPYA